LGKLTGILTVTDLIDVLIHYHNETNVIKDLVEVHTIRKWRAIGHRKRPSELISTNPEENLWNIITILENNKIRRIPVVADGSLLHVISHAILLAYLVKNIDFDLPIFKKTLVELGIGTFSESITSTGEEKLFDVINKFSKHQISAVPIVNSSGVVINVYSRTDVMYITKSFDLDQTVEEALKTRPKIPVYTCVKTETLENVLKDLSKSRIHRLVIVDSEKRVIGVVSVSDILKFFIKNNLV
jgi:5'-AMP-activated protein kinase regulatory gamma subunit